MGRFCNGHAVGVGCHDQKLGTNKIKQRPTCLSCFFSLRNWVSMYWGSMMLCHNFSSLELQQPYARRSWAHAACFMTLKEDKLICSVRESISLWITCRACRVTFSVEDCHYLRWHVWTLHHHPGLWTHLKSFEYARETFSRSWLVETTHKPITPGFAPGDVGPK